MDIDDETKDKDYDEKLNAEPEENWRGKTKMENTTRTTNRTYRATNSILEPQVRNFHVFRNHHIFYIIQTFRVAENVQLTKLVLLPNGNLNRGRGRMLLKETTAFDTFMYIIFCRASDDNSFRTNLVGITSDDMQNFMESYFKDGVKPKTLASRNLVKTYFVMFES